MDYNLYKIHGILWEIDDSSHETFAIGPFCTKCFFKMNLDNTASEFSCINCKKDFKLSFTVGQLRSIAPRVFDAQGRSKRVIISLDEPPTHLKAKAKDENEKYFLEAKMGFDKAGKKVGVIYFGERMEEQSKTDYSQIFLDLDDEQVRFDKSNKHPKELLAKFKVEFPDSTQEFIKK